jgi:hypothetical protein
METFTVSPQCLLSINLGGISLKKYEYNEPCFEMEAATKQST